MSVFTLSKTVDRFVPMWVRPIIGLMGNLFLVWIFLRMFIEPMKYEDWIFERAFFVFLFEFLSVHATVMTTGKPKNGKKPGIVAKLFLLVIYSIFAVTLGIQTNEWLLPVMFFVSTLAKIAAISALPKKRNNSGWALFMVFMIVIFSLAFLSDQLVTWFPLPAELMEGRKYVQFDPPQLFMAWGVVYYSVLFLLGLFFGIRGWIEGFRVELNE